jgi:hypothetical protein
LSEIGQNFIIILSHCATVRDNVSHRDTLRKKLTRVTVRDER